MALSSSAHVRQWTRARILPFLKWLPMVNRQTASADLLAGITGAIVVLPQSVAFATLAGMPPQYGLYAGMVPAIVAALFGSSWHLVSGPTTAASIVLFTVLSEFAEPASAQYVELALTLTLMVALTELTLGLFKLGTIVNFISHSVIIGFTAGAGVLIAMSQLKHYLGLSIPRGAKAYEAVVYVASHLGDVSLPIAATATATLLVGLLSRRFLPRVPYMIVAILGGTIAAAVLNFGYGAAVPTVGALPSTLPPFSMPSFDPEVWRKLAPTAIAVTVFALTEAMSISRALAVRSGQHIDASQEFIGQGLSNIAGAFFSGYVATGSFNRSGVNYDAGARTPLGAVFAGLFLMIVVLFVAPYAVFLPNAAMAGVLMLVAWGLIDWHHVAQIVRTSGAETAVLSVTFLATLTLDLELAIFAGMLLSVLLYLNRTSNPRLVPRVPDPLSGTRKFTDAGPGLVECKQFRLFRLDGSLFFGAVSSFTDAIRDIEEKTPECKHVAITMTGVNFIDIGGAEALVGAAKRLRARGGGLYLIRVKKRVMELLNRGRYTEQIGAKNFFDSTTTAVRTVYRKLDYDMCRACERRVFVECMRMGKQEPLDDDEPPAEAEIAAKSQDNQPAAGNGA
ncbi:MAG: SulP family inorganic anion transporter [Beijerinckiaceae bacterium]